MLTAVSRLGNGSAWPSEYLSSETGALDLVLAGLSFYKQKKAKLDGYGSLNIDRMFDRANEKFFLFLLNGWDN